MNWYLKVLKDFKNFDGRASRQEYWMFVLFNVIISIVITFIGGMIKFPFLGNIYSLLVLVPSIAVAIRRMHDIGKSGWYCLIPFYNIYLACQPSQQGANEYGEEPK